MQALEKEDVLKLKEYKTHKKLKKYLEPYQEYSSTLKKSLIINFFSYEVSFLIINKGSDIVFDIQEERKTLKKNQSCVLFSSSEKIKMSLENKVDFILLEFKAVKLAYFFNEYIDENNIGFSHIRGESFFYTKEDNENFIKNLDSFLLNKFEVIKTPFSIINLVSYLEENKGVYDIESLLLLVNVSRRVLDKAFRLYVGMSVKTYASLIKKKHEYKK